MRDIELKLAKLFVLLSYLVGTIGVVGYYFLNFLMSVYGNSLATVANVLGAIGWIILFGIYISVVLIIFGYAITDGETIL